jgi:hypothetical protein
MNRFVHYHNVTVLARDGRVIATGGAGLTANNSFAGDDMSIEAFEPPYLFRGVRPEIRSISSHSVHPGATISVEVGFTETPTEVVLVSARASTHWVDGGPQRFLSLPFTKTNHTLTATLPSDPVKALAGWYLLFVMVDDIPSKGEMVRILPAQEVPMQQSQVSVTTVSGTAREGSSGAQLLLSRTSATSAPLRIDFDLVGNGPNDLNIGTNFVIIPAGERSALLTLGAAIDSLQEGPRAVTLALRSSPALRVDPVNASASILVEDSQAQSAPERLMKLVSSGDKLSLSYSGPAGRLIDFESSADLSNWKPLAFAETTTNESALWLTATNSHEFFRARER